MALIDTRDVLAFPAGDNSSDTLIKSVHYNLTTLKHWNYTYYSNDTFSNGSRCYLLFERYTPYLLQNGTFRNSTSCYSPISPMGTRSIVGIVYACIFAFSIVLTLINLRKHGRLFLPTEKRFKAVGRRWQWYWMLAVATFAIISSITDVDVDRYYLPELPIVLANFFWFLMLPATMAAVWESVRHWGSWQERQMVDPNPFLLRQDDRRGKVEFYIPLVFYFFFWLNFFMVIPRSWSPIEKQRSPSQAALIAKPSATDIRFKLAAFFLLCSWLTVVYSLRHSIKYYKPQNRGLFNRFFGFIRYTPSKFMLTLPLSLGMVAYAIGCSFDFSISPLNLEVDLGTMYGWGWGSVTLILAVHEIGGFFDPNEDRELIRQRRIRGAEIDQEMGITKKPHWWSRLHGDNRELGVHERIARNVSEVGGGQATTRGIESNIEMGNMPASRTLSESHGERPGRGELDAVRLAANLLFPANNGIPSSERRDGFRDNPNRGRSPGDATAGASSQPNHRSNSSSTQASGATLGAQPQQIRSMLDV
ncbi:hypothetical protein D0Z07_7299 [Hyphodiscus hymeniophilus]|uniref:Uncharacterized protein n=1 Tax=Hyphodiscus hymeniophilus TaxID=353542 RepID=A0A9P6VGG0_9HELO|nr:hypothetical protein D0Z07_7299 [Hyphodiscus hymeniophilus]